MAEKKKRPEWDPANPPPPPEKPYGPPEARGGGAEPELSDEELALMVEEGPADPKLVRVPGSKSASLDAVGGGDITPGRVALGAVTGGASEFWPLAGNISGSTARRNRDDAELRSLEETARTQPGRDYETQRLKLAQELAGKSPKEQSEVLRRTAASGLQGEQVARNALINDLMSRPGKDGRPLTFGEAQDLALKILPKGAGASAGASAGAAPRGGSMGGGGIAPAMPMARDAEGNLLPGLVRVGMSQSVQGQVPLPKEVYDLYGGAAEHALGGAVSEAQAAKQEAQAKAEGAAQASAVHQQMAQRRMQAEDRRLDEVDGIMMDMEDTLEKMRNSKIDPEAWMASKSGFGKVMTAIGLAMTTWSAAVNHTENVGLKMIQQGIQNSIDAQKANFEILGRQMGEQRNLYAAMLQKHGDERSAEAATEAALLNVVKLEFEKKLAIAQDPRIRANLEGGIARVQEALANKMVELAKLQYGQRSRGEQFALPRPRGGGGGGAPKKKTDAPHWFAEKYSAFLGEKHAIDTAVVKLKAYNAKHQGEDPYISPFGEWAVRKYVEGGPLARKAYVAAFGADAEAVLRSSIGAIQRERSRITGAHHSEKEAAEYFIREYGSGGPKRLGEGLQDMQSGLDEHYSTIIGGDPEQYEQFKANRGEYGLGTPAPRQSPPSLPVE